MSTDSPRHEIARKTVVYQVATDAVTIRRNVPYGVEQGEQRTLDLYHPPEHAGSDRPSPAVLFVTGYPDAGMRRMLGCIAKEMASYVSWARLVAASGMVGITYENRTPPADAMAVVQYVQRNASSLGIDTTRIAVWACSGNAPTALSVLMDRSAAPACAVLCYGYMLDVDGAHDVADAARAIRFANPSAGRTVEDLPPDLPMFVVRAGRDQTAGLNASIDMFVVHALAFNRPVTLVNHHTAPHAFDILDNGDASRGIIRQIVAFLQFHLGVSSGGRAVGGHGFLDRREERPLAEAGHEPEPR
jgi:hypothetical protein